MNRIWLKVNFKNYYNLINKLNNTNLNIYEIVKYKNYILLKIKEDDYDKLCKYIVSYKFNIYKNTGVIYFKDLIINNLLYFMMVVLSLILILFFNNIIVDVNIIHSKNEIVNLIERELIEHNIKPLTFKKSFDEITEIKNSILDDYPDKIDWIEIEIVGMNYIVRVEERIITKEEENNEYCNVYAKEDGMITNIIVEEGEALVTRGDYVKKGDILISGDIILNDELKGQVCASGTVKAEKWYETDISLPLNYFEEEFTNNNRYNLILEHENIETKLLSDRLEDYISYETLIFDIFGYKLYLQNNKEIIRTEKKYDEESALNTALSLIEDKINLKLKENEEIIDKKVLKKVVNNSTIELRVFIITEEIIS